MRKTILLIVVMWFVTSIVSCKKDNVVDNPSQVIPTISVTSPLNNSTITDSVLITTTTTNDSDIVKVEFYIDGALAYTRSTMPWQYNWNVLSLTPNTTHTIQAKAYTKANNIVLSQIVTVTTYTPNNTIIFDYYTSNPTFTGVTFSATVISPVNVIISFAYGRDPYSTASQTTMAGKVQTLSTTVKDLIPGSSYRWRLDIYGGNLNNFHSADSTFTTSTDISNAKSFVYPLSIGNSWKYSYYSTSHTTGEPNPPYTSGIHTWNVVGQHSSNDSIVYEIECVYQDTLVSINGTAIVNKTIPFTIEQSQYGTRVNTQFAAYTYSEVYRVPRFVLTGTDTITRSVFGGFSTYVNNIGLLNYSHRYSGNSTDIERLNLISFVKQ